MSSLKTPVPKTDRLTKDPAATQQQAADKKWGIYIGVVRSTRDISLNGKIQVFIPELSKDPSSNSGLFNCDWTSPFAGATDPEVGADIKKYKSTRKSYGMWMVPPDKGNIVLVCFADGNILRPFVIACTFAPGMNHMVPGMPGGKSYGDPGINAPVAEKNPRDANTSQANAIRPLHVDNAEWIVKQGLINDPIRGAGNSGARRESPSEVFGILTPGPPDPTDPKNRLGGHSFIMDDGVQTGNRHIRLRTAQGNQILMDDMMGIIYFINKKGNAWFEMDMNGHVQIYAEGGISMRTRGNFNLRADKNVNIEAGNDVQIRAAGDNIGVLSEYNYLGPNPLGFMGFGPLGTGGDVRIEAAGEMSTLATTNMKTTAMGGDYDISAGGRIAMTASGPAPKIGGISMNSPGPILVDSKLGITLNTLGTLGAKAGATATILAPIINLNTGALPPAVPIPAVTATPMALTASKDQPFKSPEFDRDKGLKGEPAMPTAGKRVGKQDNVESIVANFITAEPFSGHTNVDPTTENSSMIGENPSMVPIAPGAASLGSVAPATVVMPNGTLKVGTGYADSNGNVVSGKSPGG